MTMESGMTPEVCLTCPARRWVSEDGTYICDPSVFTVAKYHPDGGTRLRPVACPQTQKVSSQKAVQMLRQLLKK